MWSEYFDIALTQALPPAPELLIALNGAVRGSGRTVAGGASAAGDAIDPVSGELRQTIAGADWTRCPDGQQMCWKETRERQN